MKNGGNTEITAFIVEDEFPARELMVDYVTARPELKLVGFARDAAEALEKLRDRDIDLLFLDVQLPDRSGIELLGDLQRVRHVVFTTAHDGHAIRAFEIGAVDYLLKPISEERFQQAVDRVLAVAGARDRWFQPSQLGLSIKEGDNHFLIPHNEIVYLTSHGKRTIIHGTRRDHESARLLKDVEADLPAALFQRVHKQYVVNLGYLSHIQHLIGGRYEAYLKDEDESVLPVGRQYADALKSKMNIK